MDKIIVQGDRARLTGTVEIEGAKNAALPLLAATILPSEGVTTLRNVPVLSDIEMMIGLVKNLDISLDGSRELKQVVVHHGETIKSKAPYEFVTKMRASIVVMGPILARNHRALIAMPGGCAIGSRPIDLHLRGLAQMGVTITQKNGYIDAMASELKGADIYLDFPSVGATQNLMMAATLAKGRTTIGNAAKEPEIVDLANLLNKMGAKVRGAGTDTITIVGVEKMHGTEHSVVQDRIEAGTFIVAAAITQGDVLIEDAISEHNRPLIAKLTEMGVSFREEENGLRVIGPKTLKPANVTTLPHPGFPTDMQAQMTIAQSLADGESSMTETVFENRFQHLVEMQRMGLDVTFQGNHATINGGHPLEGAEVKGTDLRSTAALVLAGLVAEGKTTVTGLQYLDRGYFQFHQKLQKLGADVTRVTHLHD
ncbi:MAG: UDP-N-acetylglucosamine 1-carboxyvinyltransferase [Streptococcaceae bacterium]|jgi:UDP-N-acetylglucosamine 1-carboxyvinyltransferase|nr:UDP-N-acetylglucosamine 1-carboxyvinyltransferase [Streptococcaceae bacterium]